MSNLVRILLTSCLLLALASCKGADAREMSIYRSFPIDGVHSEVRLDRNRGKLTLGDLMVDLQICADAESFKCFSSEFLSFAVPKDLVSPTAPWTVGEVEYRLVGYSEEMFLGQAAGVFAITARINDTDLVFYYTKQRGLLGISGLNAGSTLLLSIEYCGFGAANDCTEPP